MKSINQIIAISVVVLGLGTSSLASAESQNNLDNSLRQVLVNQSQQVSQHLTEQLKQSISTSLKQMMTFDNAVTPQSTVMITSQQKKLVSQNNVIASEE
ncbi:hypothetical protein [Thalassotalea sp. G2M2-11]|uniref:hypothetical protein n=1 Tax=Thalassotalea sp. G2M2-11 TaxID=2787627 RepID=UPI0019CF6138|nr:hypothetical protein [Thalassotalea sp. G2M2-11]